MKNFNLLKILKLLIYFFLIVLLIYYFQKNIGDFYFIKNSLNYFYFLFFIFPLILIMFFTGGLNLKYFLLPYNINLKIKECFGLFVVTTMWNYLTPFRGGAIYRASYLKKKYDFSVTNFISTLTGLYVVIFFVNALVGVFVLLLLLRQGYFSIILFGLFLSLLLFTTIIIFFTPVLKLTKYSLLNKFISVINAWNKISKNKKVIIITSAVAFLNIALTTVITIFEYKMFDISIGLLNAFYLSVIGAVSLLISITPGAIGIRETILVFSATVINIPMTQVIAVSILDRLVWFAIIFILGPIFNYSLLRQ